MTTIDDLGPLLWGGIRIPYESIAIHGGLRDHVHEYPHQPGGAPEKLGRRLYEIKVAVPALDRANASGRAGPNGELGAWPLSLNRLQQWFDSQLTKDLAIPQLGTMPAYCFDWSRELRSRWLNGERCEFSFREDQSAEFGVAQIVEGKRAGFSTSFAALEAAATKLPSTDFIQQIRNAYNSVVAIQDQANMWDMWASAKLATLTELLRDVDRRWDALNDPDNNDVLEALLELWQAAVELEQDVLANGSDLQVYTVPVLMSAAEISQAIYGTTEKAWELTSLNPFDDPYAVPAGTQVHYYAAA
jgi:hypothetical protein